MVDSTSLAELLTSIDAPEVLVTWVREGGWELAEAWERTPEPSHRLWLAGCAGAPIERAVEAAAAAVFAAMERFSGLPEALASVVTLAVTGGTPAELLAAAGACEDFASGRGSYRDARSPGFAALCRASALVAHAAEGLASGEARREAVRLDRAREVGRVIGAGAQIGLPSPDGLARLDVLAAASDPAQGAFLFAIAAAAEAVREAGEALEEGGAEPAAVRALLEPAVRAALAESR